MHPGDVLALISDGVYEFENRQGLQFGEDGVAETLRKHFRLDADELCKQLIAATLEHADGLRETTNTVSPLGPQVTGEGDQMALRTAFSAGLLQGHLCLSSHVEGALLVVGGELGQQVGGELRGAARGDQRRHQRVLGVAALLTRLGGAVQQVLDEPCRKGERAEIASGPPAVPVTGHRSIHTLRR